MNRQAKAGGEIGVNGEFYEGGQFLPSSENTIKGAQKPTISKGKKFEVAPYVWEPAPADDMLSIYDRITHTALDNRRECEFVKGQGFIGFQFTECVKTYAPSCGGKFNYATQQYDEEPHSAEWIAWVERLIEKFNNGERWFHLADDPFHFKNQK